MGLFTGEIKEDGIGTKVLEVMGEFEAERAIAALESEGIVAYKHQDHGNQLMGLFLGVADSHPVSIFVAKEREEQAKKLLLEMGFLGEIANTSGIRLLTHASLRLELAGKVLYVDPYHLREDFGDGDLILITHGHEDHFSPEDIAHVQKADSHFLLPKALRPRLGEMPFSSVLAGRLEENIHFLSCGEQMSWQGISIEAVLAYNIDKGYHPREAGGLGYVIDDGKRRVYVAGDTDATEEAKAVICDIAILPCGGVYTCDAREAASLANAIAPDIVIPSHYGTLVGDVQDAKLFTSLVDPQIQVEQKMEYQ